MIIQVVSPWEAIARYATLTARIDAQMWPVSMSVHAMSLSFVPEETGSGRELLLGTRFHLATEGLQMRVNVLAGDTRGG